MKLTVREMPTIPLMAYNVFTAMDETYWTGYPNAATTPYTDPGAELGQHPVHDGEAQAEAVMATWRVVGAHGLSRTEAGAPASPLAHAESRASARAGDASA